MEKKLSIIALMPFLLFWHWFEPVAKKNDRGIKAYQTKEFNKALDYFLSAKGINPGSDSLKNNTALALYNLKKYEQALKEFSKINIKKSGLNSAGTYYNLGNSFFRMNKLKKALESYKKSLLLNPNDLNAKKNYELTKKKLKERKIKNSGKNNKEKKNDKKNSANNSRYKNIFKYLNRKEREKMLKKKKKSVSKKKNEKDW